MKKIITILALFSVILSITGCSNSNTDFENDTMFEDNQKNNIESEQGVEIEDNYDATKESLELSEIQLEDVSYTFSKDNGNEGAVGGMCITANVLSPNNAKTVLIARWGQNISEWSQNEINEQALRYAQIWKEANVHIEQDRTFPYEIGVSHPVDEKELGTHNEVLLIGLDENYTPVGYVIVDGQIPESINSGNEEMLKYKGVYHANNKDVSLTIFDINASKEVFFELGLKDTWVVVGTAYLDGDCAEFAITDPYDDSATANAGTITFKKDALYLNITSTQVNFENNIGSYVLTKSNDIKLGATYSDNRIRLKDHTIFKAFVENAFAYVQTEWQYLGQTLGEFNNLSFEGDLNADLYRLVVGDVIKYYSVDLADLMDERECGVREIMDGVLTPYIFIMDLTGNSYFTPESEFYNNSQEELSVYTTTYGEKQPSSYTANNTEYFIGGTGPLTGDASSYGISVQNGASLAVEVINANGGLNGVNFKLDIKDDQATRDKASTAYDQLFEAGMQISLGSVTSGSCEAFATKADADDMFYITPSASAEECIESDNGFRICLGDPDYGVLAARELAAKHENIGVIYDVSDIYSTLIYEAFEDEMANLGKEYLVQTFDAEKRKDFSTQVEVLKSCDVIFLPIYCTEASLVTKACVNEGCDALIFGCDGFDGIADQVDETVTNTIQYITPFDVNSTDENVKSFVDAYTVKYNEVPDQFAAGGYDAVKVIFEAMKRAGVNDVTIDPATLCENIIPVITAENFVYVGATGTMTWNVSGTCTKVPTIIEIKK